MSGVVGYISSTRPCQPLLSYGHALRPVDMCVCVCLCVRACVRACVCVCVCVVCCVCEPPKSLDLFLFSLRASLRPLQRNARTQQSALTLSSHFHRLVTLMKGTRITRLAAHRFEPSFPRCATAFFSLFFFSFVFFLCVTAVERGSQPCHP